ncbi:ABC transporter ATP-binding protein [uncultured Jatrophihabitans sp.]|uniref:ABC transporter ATP-binding protein n=1 Tax=uncultured Jatrophihabitans sp. TaxID=1610747 RepID=UPI0035CB9F44
MTEQEDVEAQPDLYLEQLQEKVGPRRWAGVGPVVSAFRMLGQVGRFRLFALAGAQVLVAGLGAVQVLLVKQVLQTIVGAGQHDVVGRVLPYLLVLIAISTVTGAVGVVQNQTQVVLSELVVRATWHRVLAVAAGVPLLAYERPAFYDRLHRIIGNTLSKPLLVVQGAISLASGLFGMAGLMIVILVVSPLLLPILFLAVVPLYLIARVGGRIDYEFAVAQTPNLRLRYALTDLLTRRESAGEVRAFRLAGLVRRRYAALYVEYLDALRAKSRRRVRLALASGAATFVVSAGAASLLLYLVHRGSVSIAAAGAVAVAVVLLAGRIEQTFAGVSRIMDSALFIAELDDFSAAAGQPPSDVDTPGPASTPIDFRHIELDNVSFRYPGAQVAAVSGVSATIPRGKVIALVGENGSGKTTLSKILAGLYPPTDGAIRWDGLDMSTLDEDRIARSVAIVFQDFVRYEMSLADNVGVGSPDRIEDKDAVRRAADAAGLTTISTKLPRGLDTFMSARFPNGADLSVGQWQRVALARALFRDAPLVIMDEPTAALDARSEAALFEVIAELRRDRTVILVTHRFATTKSADHILVMDGGRVIEGGDHNELMRLDGVYAEMFTLQSAPFTEQRRPKPMPRAAG